MLAPVGAVPTGRVCLGGMLASDYATLAAEAQGDVTAFVDENLRWLTRTLAGGRDAGALAYAGAPEAATALFSGLEGAMFVARASHDLGRYRAASGWLLAALGPTRPA